MALRIPKRRRIEQKTDYKARKTLLKTELPRIAIRRTNKYFIIQLIESKNAQDKVLSGTNSKELLKHGWDSKHAGSLKSIPAGYLTGLLFAKKIKHEKCIIDLGMARTISGNRVFSVVKGLIDGGIKLNFNEKIFPSKERLEGAHLKPEVKAIIAKVKKTLGEKHER